MHTSIPSAAQVNAELMKLSHAQVVALAKASGVPFTTLWKIRGGETDNPRLETVRAFMPHLSAVAA
jgi:predicted transcriptional regulator